MRSRDSRTPGMEDLDQRTGQVMSPWFASRTASPPPPGILAGVEERVPTTRRRAAWRIPDWWMWRRGGGQQTGFVLATATSVLVLALLGLTSAGFFMVAVVDAPAPAPVAPGVITQASPDQASEEMADVISQEGVVTSPDVWAVKDPAVPALPQVVATKATGAVAQAPNVVNEGSSSTSPRGVTDTTGIETEALVEFDDERLSGNQRVVRNERHFGVDGQGTVATGIISIENDGGSWSGTFESVTPPDRDGPLRAVELIGDGDYAGLSALLHYDLAKAWGDPEMITGVVVPQQRPPDPKRAQLVTHSEYYGEKPFKPKLRKPDESDRAGLPAAVAGSMAMTIEWNTHESVYDDPVAEMQFIPMYSASDLTLDDPRLDFEHYEALLNSYYYEWQKNGSSHSGVSRGDGGSGGAWQGRIRGFSQPDDEAVFLAGLHLATELTGTGAYEGLSALLFNSPDPATELDIYDTWTVEGMLFAGDLPPHPEAP